MIKDNTGAFMWLNRVVGEGHTNAIQHSHGRGRGHGHGHSARSWWLQPSKYITSSTGWSAHAHARRRGRGREGRGGMLLINSSRAEAEAEAEDGDGDAGMGDDERLGFVFITERLVRDWDHFAKLLECTKLRKRKGPTCQVVPNNSWLSLAFMNDGTYMRACVAKNNNKEIGKFGAAPGKVGIHQRLSEPSSEEITLSFFFEKGNTLFFHDCSAQLVSFLCATNARCGANSPARTLPQSILRDIGCLHHDMEISQVIQKAPPTASVVFIKGLVEVEVYAALEAEYMATMGMVRRRAEETRFLTD
ncbi:hypothetical protein Pelo_2137 [Pelomyxa schiedti]|nr:hypothetical protein Pelo_2137 [Pelomyxa schiedti]